MSPSDLSDFLDKRGTRAAYMHGCAQVSIELEPLLHQACLATRSCKQASCQPMDAAAEMATAVGFLQTICSDAARNVIGSSGQPLPYFPK